MIRLDALLLAGESKQYVELVCFEASEVIKLTPRLGKPIPIYVAQIRALRASSIA